MIASSRLQGRGSSAEVEVERRLLLVAAVRRPAELGDDQIVCTEHVVLRRRFERQPRAEGGARTVGPVEPYPATEDLSGPSGDASPSRCRRRDGFEGGTSGSPSTASGRPATPRASGSRSTGGRSGCARGPFRSRTEPASSSRSTEDGGRYTFAARSNDRAASLGRSRGASGSPRRRPFARRYPGTMSRCPASAAGSGPFARPARGS